MPTVSASIPVLPSIAPLAAETDAWISDIWGVLHNGLTAFPAAGAACVRYREQGGTIVLVTNAPRPEADVAAMLARLGVPRAAYDAIVTSGDVTRKLIAAWEGQAVHHLGPERQLMIFEGLDVRLAPIEQAEVVVCTGLVDDDHETPDDYRALLADVRRRDLTMICANPDIVVERGHRLVYCAGALAQAYEEAGGKVLYAGKPHAPIYERAFELINAVKGRTVGKDRILAIGDGVKTDMAGAAAMGLRAVFIASALHVGAGDVLDARHLAMLFSGEPGAPIAAQDGLRW